jgi:membrane complex biogenesis BtpA family protein
MGMGFLGTPNEEKTILGMVHLGPLPGSPFYMDGSYRAVYEKAVSDACALEEGGAHGCLVQTVDGVYTTADDSDPARIASVANIVSGIVDSTSDGFRVGVQIMRNAARASLAVAKVCGASFVRCGVFVGATLTGDGIVEANPHAVQTYRTYLGAQDVKIIAEIDSMHFHWPGEMPTAAVAVLARYARADALGLGHPDEQRTLAKIREVREATPDLPIILSGYTTHDNAPRVLTEADGAFVGTAFERGAWGGPIDVDAVRRFMDLVRRL